MNSSVRSPTLPPVDARLIAPETGYEVVDGRVVKVAPSDPPHAIRHSKISALLETHVAEGYEVASDMLTRLTQIDDMAPDASVFPSAPDPLTGGRQIEELAFEIVSKERWSVAAKRAKKFAARGVRRNFAIDAVRPRAFEWSTETGSWSKLADSDYITDRVLAVPLPVEALARSAKADDAMARALLAKRNPVLHALLTETEQSGKIGGRAEGKAEAILTILVTRGLPLTGEEEERIRASQSDGELDGWIASALVCESVEELLNRRRRG